MQTSKFSKTVIKEKEKGNRSLPIIDLDCGDLFYFIPENQKYTDKVKSVVCMRMWGGFVSMSDASQVYLWNNKKQTDFSLMEVQRFYGTVNIESSK